MDQNGNTTSVVSGSEPSTHGSEVKALSRLSQFEKGAWYVWNVAEQTHLKRLLTAVEYFPEAKDAIGHFQTVEIETGKLLGEEKFLINEKEVGEWIVLP